MTNIFFWILNKQIMNLKNNIKHKLKKNNNKKKLDYTFHDSKNRNHDYNNKINK